MKFVNYLRFVDDLARVSATQKKHLAYIEELAKADRVWAAGPSLTAQESFWFMRRPT